MSILWEALAGGIWAASLYGALQVTQIQGDWGHEVCGPWGCGPPLQVLAGWHGFWMAFFTLPVAWVIRRTPPRRMRRVGVGLIATGLAFLAGLFIWEAATWLPHTVPGQPTYFAQRLLFRIATLVEAPVVPITLAGALFVGVATARMRSADRIAARRSP